LHALRAHHSLWWASQRHCTRLSCSLSLSVWEAEPKLNQPSNLLSFLSNEQDKIILPDGPTCPQCHLLFAPASFAIQLENQIRSHVSKYYRGTMICDDQSCGTSVRAMGVYGRRCMVSGCKGSMHLAVSRPFRVVHPRLSGLRRQGASLMAFDILIWSDRSTPTPPSTTSCFSTPLSSTTRRPSDSRSPLLNMVRFAFPSSSMRSLFLTSGFYLSVFLSGVWQRWSKRSRPETLSSLTTSKPSSVVTSTRTAGAASR
jgi:hypothetical protein